MSALFYVLDGGPYRHYPTLAEAVDDAEESIAIFRREARFDGEWSLDAEDISIYECEAETDDPGSDGKLVAQALGSIVSVDEETGDEEWDFSMAPWPRPTPTGAA